MVEENRNTHYSDQKGHFERGVINRALTSHPELSRGQLDIIDPWIARRSMRRISQDGRR